MIKFSLFCGSVAALWLSYKIIEILCTSKNSNRNSDVRTDIIMKRKAAESKPKASSTTIVLEPNSKRPKQTDSKILKPKERDGLKEKSVDKNKVQDRVITITTSTNLYSQKCKEWSEVEYVSEIHGIQIDISENVCSLLIKDNTIPFIARYRKDMTGGMEPEILRAVKISFEKAKKIKARASQIINAIDKLGKWTPNIHAAITAIKCPDKLEHIYSFFKPAPKRSLAERAREAGLESITESVLRGWPLPSLLSLVNPEKKGLQNEKEITDGIVHLMADTFNKDKTILDEIIKLQSTSFIKIKTKLKNSSADDKATDVHRTYENYYDFEMSCKNVRPHQILAINRAEDKDILNVKIVLPDSLEQGYKKYCLKQYEHAATASHLHLNLFTVTADYAYKKFVKPFIRRRLRNELKRTAEVASIQVFVKNVKELLLTQPLRGQVILGIDPGFSHGCKLAVINMQGEVCETNVIYPHGKSFNRLDASDATLKNLIDRHKCTVIALGNATACRETEEYLTRFKKRFDLKNIPYTVVDEAGASIYSCSAEAKAEFPTLDPNLISAVSIARRLQDPLAEYIKVDPKHLGIGMYQHDMPEKQLAQTLNEVVSEVVSFVGVDVNTASHCLLKNVAGLSVSKAANIVEWRTKKGPFQNRQQLLDVKGIGSNTFEQCSGFLRVLPETSKKATRNVKSTSSKSDLNPLDQTCIHPESYKTAERFVRFAECSLEDLGTPAFIEKIKSVTNEIRPMILLASKFDTSVATMSIIVNSLCTKKNEDIRSKSQLPLFRDTMRNINDLRIGTPLTGAVRNVTHFGTFVDVGVGVNGLLPTKFSKDQEFSIGQRIHVKVRQVDAARQKICLELIN